MNDYTSSPDLRSMFGRNWRSDVDELDDQVELSLEIRGLTSREESKETRKPMNRYVP